MVKFYRCSMSLIIGLALVLTGCATQSYRGSTFKVQPIPDGNYNLKADNLYFVLDASSSMGDDYKFETAREVIAHFNQTMPEVDLQAALRSFGHDSAVASRASANFYGLQNYSQAGLGKGLEKIKKPGGISPLDRALKDAAGDLKEVNNRIAMIIVSDGEDMGAGPVNAAKALKAAHGDRLCIYTVQVGESQSGGALLYKVAQAAGCGRALTADQVASGADMNAFVKEVLIAGMADSDGDGVADDKDRCPNTPSGVQVDRIGCPLDSDKDGVVDYKDKCPGTPRGRAVDANGCPIPVATKSAEVTKAGTWLYKDIQFETNKWDLKQSSFATLNEITAALNAQPDLRVEIQGHTDNTGARGYNLQLSDKRAKSVRSYLASQGIAMSRMEAKGYGPDRPIESNSTKEGRARNRRVEIKPLQ